MRSHPVFTAFQRRWQLSVYFQLRWKEVVTKLEETLSSRILDPEATNFAPGELSLYFSACLWLTILKDVMCF